MRLENPLRTLACEAGPSLSIHRHSFGVAPCWLLLAVGVEGALKRSRMEEETHVQLVECFIASVFLADLHLRVSILVHVFPSVVRRG